jgi:hypothetical protein
VGSRTAWVRVSSGGARVGQAVACPLVILSQGRQWLQGALLHKAMGVLASDQSGRQASQAPWRTVTNPAFERPLRGLWGSRRTRLGRPIA